REPGSAGAAPGRRCGLVRLRDAVRRTTFAERLSRNRTPVPYGDPVRGPEDGSLDGLGGPALRLARGRALRSPRQADFVSGLPARSALYGRADGGRVSSDGEPARRDAVARIPGSAASGRGGD